MRKKREAKRGRKPEESQRRGESKLLELLNRAGGAVALRPSCSRAMSSKRAPAARHLAAEDRSQRVVDECLRDLLSPAESCARQFTVRTGEAPSAARCEALHEMRREEMNEEVLHKPSGITRGAKGGSL